MSYSWAMLDAMGEASASPTVPDAIQKEPTSHHHTSSLEIINV